MTFLKIIFVLFAHIVSVIALAKVESEALSGESWSFWHSFALALVFLALITPFVITARQEKPISKVLRTSLYIVLLFFAVIYVGVLIVIAGYVFEITNESLTASLSTIGLGVMGCLIMEYRILKALKE